MTTPNLSIAHLEQLLALAKKKLTLALDLEHIEKEISAFFGGHPAPATSATAAKKPGRKPGKAKIPRGALKDRILTALEEAWPDGISVADLAEKLGAKKNSVNQWIYTTGKKSGVTKVARGKFVFTGGKTAEAPKESPAKPQPAAKRTSAKAPKGRIARGTLKPSILAALSEAGAGGLSVAEVAEKINGNKNAVNVWFYTTGKKVKGLKKVARGRFSFKG